jgi:hypothetical protein
MDGEGMTRGRKKTIGLALIAWVIACVPARALDALAVGFQTPPDSAKPRVWWHWLNGNVSKEGIRLDLEWMKRVGIAGVTQIDLGFDGLGAAFEFPPLVKQPLVYLSPAWQQALRYSADLANALGLDFGMTSAAGWNTGGPWVRPEEAMKKLVWSETYVRGGAPFKGRLAHPPVTTGLFQNIPRVEFGTRSEGVTPPSYYADVAAIAYRAPVSEIPNASAPIITSSAGPINAARLADKDLATAVSLPFGQDRDAWIQFSYPQPRRVQALTAVIGRALNQAPREGGWLEASNDGHTFRKVVALPKAGAPQQTVSFAPIVARVFRVVLERPQPTVDEQLGVAIPPSSHSIAELVLQSAARVNRFEDKAGFSTRQILDEDDTPPVADADAIRPRDIIDLTSRMHTDGSLDWTPPQGQWVVLRFGYSLTGSTNFAGAPAGRGLEVDKLSHVHMQRYLKTYLGELETALGRLGPHGLQSILSDSYEVGTQNWTDDLLAEFKRRRGYGAVNWLPVLTGRVVQSALVSDRFLWDFRQTLGDLMAEAHYGDLAAAVHARGMTLYAESQESGRAFIGDGMQAKKDADFPMGALWAALEPGTTRQNYDADIRESASVSHIYGKKLVAAESFTSLGNTYAFDPENLKPFADRALALGVNRFIISCSVHQTDSQAGPGLSLGPFGVAFTRKETWGSYAAPWVEYLTRSSYLLQQGRFVADIAYLYGEDTNVTSLFHTTEPPIPDGYNFDFINPDSLLHELSVKDRQLVTRFGMPYRVLALDGSTRRMSVPILRKIRDLVHAGAVVVGEKPDQTPSLADDETEFREIVAELWGEVPGARTVGLGRVIADRSLADALMLIPIVPDVTFKKTTDAELRFTHRTLDSGDLYFISNGTAQAQVVEASFRVRGKAPELWRADTGMIVPLSYRVEKGRTIVPLKLDPNDAVFVVFRQPTSAEILDVPEPMTTVVATLDGPWQVSFPPHLGAPPLAHLDRLSSWTGSTDAGVRYFSGTATYDKRMVIAREWLKEHSRVQLDLGSVKNVAEVLVNGRSMGILWKAPFKLDITDALRVGDNVLEIKVTNLWPNRLIGDQQPGAQKIAFATFDPFKADSPLLPSGLLGPVTLLRVDP